MAIRNAKDNSFRLIFNEPELFVNFLKDFIDIDILKNVTAADIEDMTERFIPLFQDSKESDTVKRVNLDGENPLFIIAILEHQSGVNYRTSFRMLQYITLVLAEYEKEEDRKRKNASRAKDFMYPPVLPIVFYDGQQKWTAETDFYNKTNLNEAFGKYIPRFQYELVSLNEYSEQDIARFGDALSMVLLIDRIGATDGTKLLEKLPPDYIDRLQLNVPDHLQKLLSDVITVLLKRINVPDDEIAELTEYINERGYNEMFEKWNNYDVQELRRIYREEGREEGRQETTQQNSTETASRMLQEGLSVELIARCTLLTIEEIQKIKSESSLVSEPAPEYRKG